MKSLIRLLIIGVFLLGLFGTVNAADVPLPANTTVRLVVPYSPGGGYDTYARLMAPSLEKAQSSAARILPISLPQSVKLCNVVSDRDEGAADLTKSR